MVKSYFGSQNDISTVVELIMDLISGQIEHVVRIHNHHFNPELRIKYVPQYTRKLEDCGYYRLKQWSVPEVVIFRIEI
jgi:hypothetical protein